MTFLKPAGVVLAMLSPVAAQAAEIEVAKSPTCGCCGAWIQHMAAAGHDMTEMDLPDNELTALKTDLGVPGALMSCHTAQVDGYVIEGHVPASDVERLLAERPDAVGLSVPGMVVGTPGMGPREGGDAFDVLLVRKDGSSEVFAAYPAG